MRKQRWRYCRLSSHRFGVILILFSFFWGIYLVKIQLEDGKSESQYIKDKIISLSKDYIQALAKEKGVFGVDGNPQSGEYGVYVVLSGAE